MCCSAVILQQEVIAEDVQAPAELRLWPVIQERNVTSMVPFTSLLQAVCGLLSLSRAGQPTPATTSQTEHNKVQIKK